MCVPALVETVRLMEVAPVNTVSALLSNEKAMLEVLWPPQVGACA